MRAQICCGALAVLVFSCGTARSTDGGDNNGGDDSGEPTDSDPADSGPHDSGPRDSGSDGLCDASSCDSSDAGPIDAGPVCMQESGLCSVNSDCCPGLTCDPTLLECLNAQSCQMQNGPCQVDSECCFGLFCGMFSQCEMNPDTDGGVPDAGPIGPTDAGPVDAGPPDAGSIDAGSIMGTFPGVVSTELSTSSPTVLRPTSDGEQVVLSNGVSSGGFSSACGGDFYAAAMSLATVGGSVVSLTTNGSITQSGFTADGANFVWGDYQGPDGSDCSPVVMAAPLAGGMPTEIGYAFGTSTAGWFDDFAVAGNSAFWVTGFYPNVLGDPGELAGTLVSGGFQRTFSTASTAVGSPSPDGTAIYYSDNSGAHLSSISGTVNMTEPSAIVSWSPDASQLAMCTSTGLNVVSSAGSAVASLGSCSRVLQYSPDGTAILTADSSGNLLAVPVGGGAAVTMSGLPTSGEVDVNYEGDSLVLVQFFGSTTEQIFVGDTVNGGPLVLVGGLGSAVAWDAEFAHCAVAQSSGAQVFSFPGGSATTVGTYSASGAAYEATGSELLAVAHDSSFTTGLGTLDMYLNDGSAPVQTVSNTALLNTPSSYGYNVFPPAPFWLNTTLIYAVNPHGNAGGDLEYDLAATSEDGSQTGILAAGVSRIAAVPATGRLFYVRTADAGGGVWFVDLP